MPLDEHHLTNSLRFLSLLAPSSSPKYLGKTEKCVIEKDGLSYNILYIDRSPESIMKKAREKKKEKQDQKFKDKMLLPIKKNLPEKDEKTENIAHQNNDEQEKFEKSDTPHPEVVFNLPGKNPGFLLLQAIAYSFKAPKNYAN